MQPSDHSPMWRSLSLAAAVAVLVALLSSSQIQLSMMGHGHDWWRIFAWQFGGLTFWVLASPWMLRSGGRLLSSQRPRWWPGLEAAKALALSALQVPWAAAIFIALQPYEPVATYSVMTAGQQSLRTWFLLDLLIYCAGLAVGYGLEGHRRARHSELRQSQLDTELARAQLESLRLQIQPHFLFNTLHSIAALMRRQRSAKALEMLLGLAELLRVTLERSDQQRITLREELNFLRLYVDLQRARFADRLNVTYEIDEEVLKQPIPTLILQPLVENAIRHGIAPRVAPGHIRISASVEGNRLHLAVDDDGVGLPDGFNAQRDQGVGLSNTRSRLAQLYGDHARVDLCRKPEGGTTVSIGLPTEGLPAEKTGTLPKTAAA